MAIGFQVIIKKSSLHYRKPISDQYRYRIVFSDLHMHTHGDRKHQKTYLVKAYGSIAALISRHVTIIWH